jgi:hypothetical protein
MIDGFLLSFFLPLVVHGLAGQSGACRGASFALASAICC